MDLDEKQSQKVINNLPAILIVVVVLGLILFFIFRPRGEQLIVEDQSYKVFYQDNLQTYRIDLDENFYNRDPQEILDDINQINELTNNSTDAFIDVPATLFPVGNIEKEFLDNIDPDTFEYPDNPYPED